MHKFASRLTLVLALGTLAFSADSLCAQDPFGPRITATRWVMAHGRESSLRSVGIRSRDNPRGRIVPGAQGIFNRINGFNGVPGFPNPQVITLSVNQAGSLFELRPQLIGPRGNIVPDPNQPTLPRRLILAGGRLDAGMTLVVAELPSGVGFQGWHALTSRFGAGNLYATVTIPSANIVAGQELVTYNQLRAYTANSVLFEAPAFGTVVQHHGLSGGTTRVSARVGGRSTQGSMISRTFGWAQPLEMILSQEGQPRFLEDGRVVLTIRAQLPNSFVMPAPAPPQVTIRWAAESNSGTIIRNSQVLAPRVNTATSLARVARFRVVVRGVKEGDMVKISAVASPGFAPNPFITPVMRQTAPGQAPVRQSVGMTTFHSSRSTLEDTLNVRIGRNGSTPASSGQQPARPTEPYGVFVGGGYKEVIVGQLGVILEAPSSSLTGWGNDATKKVKDTGAKFTMVLGPFKTAAEARKAYEDNKVPGSERVKPLATGTCARFRFDGKEHDIDNALRFAR